MRLQRLSGNGDWFGFLDPALTMNLGPLSCTSNRLKEGQSTAHSSASSITAAFPSSICCAPASGFLETLRATTPLHNSMKPETVKKHKCELEDTGCLSVWSTASEWHRPAHSDEVPTHNKLRI